MADFAAPSGPPPPKVPEGWVARWNAQYSEWFYVNTYTKQSQWDKPTAPAVDPAHESPDGAPPGYSAGSTPAPTDSKNPFVNDATKPGGVESDEALARRLQEEENARSGGSSSGYGAPGYGAAAGAGASASYLASTPSHGQQGQYPDNNLPVRPDARSGSSTDKAKGLLGKLLGGAKTKYSSSSGSHGGYGQSQNSYYGGPQPGQYGYGGQPQYGQPQYGQPQYGGGHSSGGGLGALGGLLGRGGGSHGGGYGGHGGGYGGYGGGYGKPKKSGGGMGMMGGAALGLGAGALVGGALVADEIHDQHEEQEAYQDGYQDGGGGDYGGGDDFGGGDFGE